MASGVVSTRNKSATAERSDGDPRSTAPAPRVTQDRVSIKEATIASPCAARSVPAVGRSTAQRDALYDSQCRVPVGMKNESQPK